MPQTVVITGCSSGFGHDLAQFLARDGHRVAATLRAPDGNNAAPTRALRDLAQAEGLDLRVLDLDVTSDASVGAAAESVLETWGAPDVVVNNAGQMFGGITEAFSPDELARQLDVNVVGVHRVVRAFLPAMRERGEGLVMNVSSTAGRCALPFFGVYHASKWALEGYTAALRLELAQTGVDAVIVEPGPFTTSLFPKMTAPADADGRAAGYPPAVTGAFEAMGADFQAMLQNPETPTDPAMVVDAMAELIAMAPGTRPLRTVVGMDFGVRDRNADDAPHDAGLLEAFGMTDFATLATAA
ncbi:SDR family oxidoreductase [Rubrivirga sp. IMCC45206]|uniref:SDR family oxidoreductase n=1 Tax=Rubrivirga sp. IMCC45206 TaxID=3391614 RepID=UPI00398FFCBB